MYSVKYDPTASPELTSASQQLSASANRLIEEGQRRGVVREGPADEIGLPVMAVLHGYATLAAAGSIPADGIEKGWRAWWRSCCEGARRSGGAPLAIVPQGPQRSRHRRPPKSHACTSMW
ncbi:MULTISPECIES: WHG domain-containing protein [Streptomyces]|uniref:WHG domain-containing protein n=1 Tax=Streptomyces TaxID=1883 RepID=UPI000A37552C|nr:MULTISPECIES: WHG domain-containing protein [Streptomyces]MDX3619102.1 WHG domain-containing protein [Streptomyces europaeiscabiei]